MMGFSVAIRTAMAQAIIDNIDGGAGAGLLEMYAGGRPDTCKSISAMPAHAVSTAYSLGDYVTSGTNYYRADNGGTSAGSAPTFPTNGTTVTDNDITWQDMGVIPVKLGTLTFSDPCGTAAAGVLTFSAITEDTNADASGIAAWARATDSNSVAAADFSAGAIDSGEDIEMNTTNVVQNGPIRANSGSITIGNA